MQSDNSGYIEVDFYSCYEGDISIIVVDLNTNVQSTATYELEDNQINIGNLEACGDEIVSKVVFDINGELETIYLVRLEEQTIPNIYSFINPRAFPDGSSLIARYELRFNSEIADAWEIRTTFSNIVGSPTVAYSFTINDNFNIIEETDDYIEIEFPVARIFDEVSDVVLDEEGTVYLKAAKL